MKPPKKLPFDPKVFFSKVNGGRTISDYHNNQIVYEQSKPADSVFYIQKGKAKGTVVSEQDKEAVVAVLVPVISSARDAWPRRRFVATVVAMTQCVIVRMAKESITLVIHEDRPLRRQGHRV